MAGCSHSDRLVSLLYDDELDAARHRDLAFDLADCPDCTRRRDVLDRAHEAVTQTLDTATSRLDLSDFWTGIEHRIAVQTASRSRGWTRRFHWWRLQWQPAPFWTWSVGAAVALLIVAGVVTSHWLTGREAGFERGTAAPPPFSGSDGQARIDSLSAAETVLLWNEPTSNATVIWVSDTP